MKNAFLDLNEPLITCAFANCQTCVLKSQLHCHFNLWGLLRFLGVAFPPFILAGMGIMHFNAWLLIPWVAFALSYFGLIEIMVMCSHCPHYAQPEIKSLKCWANYGSPKLWRYNPGPMSSSEKFIYRPWIDRGLPVGNIAIRQSMVIVILIYLNHCCDGYFDVKNYAQSLYEFCLSV
jgi:hypothetical protein